MERRITQTTVRYVSTADDMPSEDHFAIVRFGSVSDGYGGTTPSVISYEAFTDRQEWEAEVARLMSSRFGSGSFKAIHVRPAHVATTVKIEIR